MHGLESRYTQTGAFIILPVGSRSSVQAGQVCRMPIDMFTDILIDQPVSVCVRLTSSLVGQKAVLTDIGLAGGRGCIQAQPVAV